MKLERHRSADRLEFSGELDACALVSGMSTGPKIGNRDVIAEINEKWQVKAGEQLWARVLLGVEPVADGALRAYHGWSGTDVTPGDWPEIMIGDWNIMNRLGDFSGHHVELIVEATGRESTEPTVGRDASGIFHVSHPHG